MPRIAVMFPNGLFVPGNGLPDVPDTGVDVTDAQYSEILEILSRNNRNGAVKIRVVEPGGLNPVKELIDYVGNGDPNGQITANPGSTYRDRLGTGGNWIWMKEGGTGNTGWYPIGRKGDTGLGVPATGIPDIVVNYNPNPVLQTSNANWALTAATLTWNSQGVATWAGTDASTVASLYPGSPGVGRTPVAAGQFFHACSLVKGLRDLDYACLVAFLDAGGATVASFTLPAQQLNNGETRMIGVTDQKAPAGTVSAYLRILVRDRGSAAIAGGDAMQVYGAVTTSTPQAVGWSPPDVPLFHGGQPGAEWVGTAHNSLSKIKLANLTAMSAIGANEYHGRGTPLNIQDANKGVGYRDDDQVAGARYWRKTSAAGVRSGWVIVEGDTDWLELPLAPGWSKASVAGLHRIRRVNERVYVQSRLSPTVGGALIGTNRATLATIIANIPVGFQPGGYVVHGVWALGSGMPGTAATFASLTQLHGYPSTTSVSGLNVATDVWEAVADWVTDNPWPTTLVV